MDPVRITQEPIVFTSEPVSRTITVGQPVTFSATVQGTPPYFVQWLSNGVAIPGADQFSYTIPSVALNMDGSRFSINVSNLAFSATSSNAVLRVNGDVTAPTLVSVASLNGIAIDVLFNEDMDQATAQATARVNAYRRSAQRNAAELQRNATASVDVIIHGQSQTSN